MTGPTLLRRSRNFLPVWKKKNSECTHDSFRAVLIILFSSVGASKAFAPCHAISSIARRVLVKRQTLCSSGDTVIDMFSCSLKKVKMTNLLWTEGNFWHWKIRLSRCHTPYVLVALDLLDNHIVVLTNMISESSYYSRDSSIPNRTFKNLDGLLVAFDIVNNTSLQAKLLQLEKYCAAATDSQMISERRSLPPGQTKSNLAPTMLIQMGESRRSWKTLHPNKTTWLPRLLLSSNKVLIVWLTTIMWTIHYNCSVLCFHGQNVKV